MMLENLIQDYENVQTIDEASLSYKSSITSFSKNDNRAMQPILDARRQNTDYALMPAGVIQAQPPGQFVAFPHVQLIQHGQCFLLHAAFNGSSIAIEVVQCQRHFSRQWFTLT